MNTHADDFVVATPNGQVVYGPATRSACRGFLRRASKRAIREIYLGRTSGDYSRHWDIATEEDADRRFTEARQKEREAAETAMARRVLRQPMVEAIEQFTGVRREFPIVPILYDRLGWREMYTVDGTNQGRHVGVLTTEDAWELWHVEVDHGQGGCYLPETVRPLKLLARLPREEAMATTY